MHGVKTINHIKKEKNISQKFVSIKIEKIFPLFGFCMLPDGQNHLFIIIYFAAKTMVVDIFIGKVPRYIIFHRPQKT